MTDYTKLLTPFPLKHLTLKNRIMSTAHAPAYAVDAMPQEQYQLYHEEKAKGGISLTMFGGSSTISPDCPASFGQLSVGEARIVPYFQQFAERIHRHDAYLMCQISHMGRRTRWDSGDWLPPVSASTVREIEHRSSPRAMEAWDFRRILNDYAKAAIHCRDGNLDGVEISASGSHLIAQFLSRETNLRKDKYGGDVESRFRFCMEVIQSVRKGVGNDFVVGVRLSGDELIDSGLVPGDGLRFAVMLAESGLVDFINITPGQADNYLSLLDLIPNMAYGIAPFVHLAAVVADRVDIPVFHAARVNNVEMAAQIVNEGNLDMVAMTRGHMADPYIVAKLQAGTPERIRKCVGANYCIDRIYNGHQALCIQNAATGREATMLHIVPAAQEHKKVVVVGGGPAGLEAARVSAERGHDVVLFEAQDKLGGQIRTASKATWRAGLLEIVDWLEKEIRLLGVDMRLGKKVTKKTILAEKPHAIIMATGGTPEPGHFEGKELTVSSWDVINGTVELAENVLVYDDSSSHQGASCAEVVAKEGAVTTLVTPEIAIGREFGGTSFATHMRELDKLAVCILSDLRLVAVEKRQNGLQATFRHEYSHQEEVIETAQVVCELGTKPNDSLYFGLVEQSSNQGEIDYDALINVQPQTVINNPDGQFQIFRVGDAITSRNIHAAIYDSLRLCLAI